MNTVQNYAIRLSNQEYVAWVWQHFQTDQFQKYDLQLDPVETDDFN